MLSVFSQKFYVDGHEHTYNCSIDDNDYIHFLYGTSNGKSSSLENPIVDNIFGELIINFPTLRLMMNDDNSNSFSDDYIYERIKKDDKVRIITITKLNNIKINEITISQNFLIESFKILENMWTDD